MIVCPRCSKENQDHYKFCLGCGAELPRDAAHAPKSFTAPTPAAGFQQGAPAASVPPTSAPSVAPKKPASGPPPAASVPPAMVPSAAPAAPASAAPIGPEATRAAASGIAAADGMKCPSCGAGNPATYKFCGACGYSLASAKASMAPAATLSAAAPVIAAGAVLVLIRPDGTEGETHALPPGTSTIGRGTGAPFAVDSYLSPKHAEFTIQGANVTVKDLGSLNGVYFRVAKDVEYELTPGDMFRIGQEILRFDPVAAPKLDGDGVETMGSPNADIVGRLSLVVGRETTANAFPIPAAGIKLGRERGDIIFPEDGYVSGLHCTVEQKAGKIVLTDVGSSNGTFLRIRSDKKIELGSLLLLGQQLFRIQAA